MRGTPHHTLGGAVSISEHTAIVYAVAHQIDSLSNEDCTEGCGKAHYYQRRNSKGEWEASGGVPITVAQHDPSVSVSIKSHTASIRVKTAFSGVGAVFVHRSAANDSGGNSTFAQIATLASMRWFDDNRTKVELR